MPSASCSSSSEPFLSLSLSAKNFLTPATSSALVTCRPCRCRAPPQAASPESRQARRRSRRGRPCRKALAAGTAFAAEASFAWVLLDELAGRLALLGVQPAVAVLVELLDEFAALVHRPAEAAKAARAVEEVLFAEVFFAFRVILLRLRRQQGHRQYGKGQKIPHNPSSLVHRLPQFTWSKTLRELFA